MPVASGGTHLYRDLEQKLPGILTPRYRELPFEAGRVVPTMVDLQAGAYEVVRRIYDEFGTAKVLADGAYDIPLVDLSSSEDRYRILMIAAAFSIGFQEERHANFAGRSLNTDKMKVASRAIQEKRNRIAAFGDTATGITGFLNNANVTLNNSSFDPYAGTTTADDLADFLIQQIEELHTASNNVFYPTAAAVSTSLYFRMVRMRMPDTQTTVLNYIIAALKEQGVDIVFQILKLKECESSLLEANGVQAGSTNKDRVVLYPLDPEVIERHVEMIKLAPPEYIERRDMKTIYPMFGCVTPVIVNYPAALRYIDVAKAA